MAGFPGGRVWPKATAGGALRWSFLLYWCSIDTPRMDARAWDEAPNLIIIMSLCSPTCKHAYMLYFHVHILAIVSFCMHMCICDCVRLVIHIYIVCCAMHKSMCVFQSCVVQKNVSVNNKLHT